MKPDAETAISILGTLLEATEPAALAFWTTPNVILTLSGARAYCDGVYWDDGNDLLEKWNKEIESSLATLSKVWSLTVSDTAIKQSRPGEKYASFEIISESGLRQVIEQTKLVDNTVLDILLKLSSLEELSKEITMRLRKQDKFKAYSDDNINHVAFGILLGYPDEAIVGSTKDWQEDDPFAEPLIRADIRGATYYICPQPIYDYPRRLVSDLEITTHEKLWSKILKDYYKSEFHRSLEADPGFRQKLRELGNLPLI